MSNDFLSWSNVMNMSMGHYRKGNHSFLMLHDLNTVNEFAFEFDVFRTKYNTDIKKNIIYHTNHIHTYSISLCSFMAVERNV